MYPNRRDFLRGSTAAGVGGLLAGTLAAQSARAEEPQPPPESQAKPSGTAQRKEAVRLAVVQQEGNPGRVEANRTKALRFAKEALEHGADVILFHEVLLTGYTATVRELAEPLLGPTTRAFQDLLQGSQARILYGLTEREGDRYYVACPIVAAEGVIANYRKTHLWWKAEGLRYEPGIYTPGDRLVTFDVQGHKCGVMICYDGDFPEMTRSYANLDCTLLFWMNNRNSRGYEEVKRHVEGNSIIMATSCCCGANENGCPCRGWQQHHRRP